jgi:hypothetical protein
MFADSPKQYGKIMIQTLLQQHPELPQKNFTDKQVVVFKNLNNSLNDYCRSFVVANCNGPTVVDRDMLTALLHLTDLDMISGCFLGKKALAKRTSAFTSEHLSTTMLRIAVFAKTPRAEEEKKDKKRLKWALTRQQTMDLNEVRFHRNQSSENFKAERDLVWTNVFQQSIQQKILAWQCPMLVVNAPIEVPAPAPATSANDSALSPSGMASSIAAMSELEKAGLRALLR